MTVFYFTLVFVLIILQITNGLSNHPSRYIQPDEGSSFNPRSPSPFKASAGYQDPQASATQQRPQNYPQNPNLYTNVIPIKQKPQGRPFDKSEPQRFASPEGARGKEKELEEEEIEEPDRLSILLPQTKFDCNGKSTGYYADEELGCEVFHYCQDNARHSWICPEGFTFHQVHLICMPPGGDNICEKSSQFYFVNEYLYKPVNLEEYQQKPNVSLRYSERFYPENYYDERDNEQDDRQANQQRNSIRVSQDDSGQANRATPFRPEASLGQVFRSPNEVNIPLQQRRPQHATPRYFTRK